MPNWWDQNQALWQQPQGQAGPELGAPPPDQPQAPAWVPGAKAGQAVTLLGFDPNKSGQGAAPGSKYNAASDAFRASIAQDTGWTRGAGNENSLNFLRSQGFQNAHMVGDDKVDFGDGQGPIDIFRSDGSLVFQNTTGNPIWEGQQRTRGASAAPMTLGSLGQPPPMPQGNYEPTQPLPVTGIDIGTQPAPTLDDYTAALRQTAPQTVQQPQALRIPGFASGVQNFQGGPAVVGELAPEILKTPAGTGVVGADGPQVVNLPPGSDVIPSSAINLGNGAMPMTPSAPMTLGTGTSGIPDIGGPQFYGDAGTIPHARDASIALGNGTAGIPPVGAPAGPPAAVPGPQNSSGGYAYDPMAAPTSYTPPSVAGPDRLTLGSIAQPGAVNAGQVGPGQAVSAERIAAQGVQTPQQIAAERVQGPQALQAQQLQNPGAFSNLSLQQFQQDPSYQFDVKEQLGALQNSAAAKGMLHHANTLRGLQETAGNLANRQYDTVNNRNLALQQQNFQNQATVAGANNAANAQAYGLTNQFQQQAALANQATALEAGKFNVGTGLQAGMFNAQNQQGADQFNAANALQAGQFNSAQAQQAALANQQANLNAGQFNAQMGYNTQAQNLQNQLAAYSAYQPLAQQNAQFNAGQQTAANQQNFANAFAVNQANNAGSLGAFNANLGAELGRGNLGVSQGQLALGNRQADQSYQLGLGQLALGNRQADQSYGLGLGNLGVSQGNLALNQQGQDYNQALNTFNTNYGIYQNNQNTAFNQGLALTQLGANAAQNYGNQAGNAYTNQGNANAGAAIGQGNAAAGALGTLGNIGQQAGYYYGGTAGIRQPTAPGGYTVNANGAVVPNTTIGEVTDPNSGRRY